MIYYKKMTMDYLHQVKFLEEIPIFNINITKKNLINKNTYENKIIN